MSVTRLTGEESQPGFEFAGVDQKTRQLERVRVRTEVVAAPAHSVPQAQNSKDRSLSGNKPKVNDRQFTSPFVP